MKKKSTWIGVGLVAVLALASAVAFADFGNGNPGSQNFDVIKDRPPQQDCNCPQIYEPVVCRAADGSRHNFSNLCFAGCSGFQASSCTRVETPVPSTR